MRNANLKMRVVVGCAALFCASGLFAQDWPQWRGPNRDNKVTGFTAPATWPKELKKGWNVTVGASDGSPVLVGDKVYTFTRVGGDEVITCLNANDGKEVWKEKYATAAPAGADKGHPGPRSTPSVGDNKVCTFGVNGILTCVDATTGKRAWQKDTKAQPKFHTAASPLIVDGTCIAAVGKDKAEVVAYDLNTGSEKWKASPDGGGDYYGSPVLMTTGGTKQLVCVTKTNLVGVSMADGKSLWKYAATNNYMNCTPITDGDMVYFSGPGTGSFALKIEKKGDAFSATQVWKESATASTQYNSPTLKDGVLYGIAKGNKLYAQDAKTGKAVDSFKGPPCGEAGAVLDVGSALVLLSQTGDMVVFAPGKEYKELAKYKVADAPWGEPILSGKRVIVKGRDALTLWTID